MSTAISVPMKATTPKMMKPRRNWLRNSAPTTLKPLFPSAMPRPPYADEAVPLYFSGAKSSQAIIGATMKFSAACPTIQQASSIGMPVANDAPIIEAMKQNAPNMIHGVRLPKRECVRSESAPATMFETAATIIPMLAKSATSWILFSESSVWSIAGRNRLFMTMYGPSQLAGPMIRPGTRRVMGMVILLFMTYSNPFSGENRRLNDSRRRSGRNTQCCRADVRQRCRRS